MPSHDIRVTRWAEELLGANVRVSPLAGGGNNYLFRCQGSAGEVVIKRYRDENFGAGVSRRAAEVTFLKYAAVVAPQFVSRLVADHPDDEMIAVTLVAGEPFRRSEEISQSDLTSAIEFYRRLNEDRSAVSSYPIAAREGYRSVTEHIKHVEQRLLRLSTDHLPKDLQRTAKSVLDVISRSYDGIRASLERQIGAGDLIDFLPIDGLQVSPGDFGFHNAIQSRSGPIFIDFEYAGLDDPAKTLSDFFLQPNLPVCATCFAKVATALSVYVCTESLLKRTKSLGAILSVKWKAIILAPLDLERFSSFKARHGDDVRGELVRRFEFASRKTLFE